MNIQDIGAKLAVLVTEQLGIQAYLAEPNQARPLGSLCSVKFFSSDQIGIDTIKYLNQDVGLDMVEEIKGMRELVYTLNFQREGSIQNAAAMKQAFLKTSVTDKLMADDLVFVKANNPVNGTDVVDQIFEERSSMDVTIRTFMTTEDIVKSIQSLEIDVTAKMSQELNYKIEVKK